MISLFIAMIFKTIVCTVFIVPQTDHLTNLQPEAKLEKVLIIFLNPKTRFPGIAKLLLPLIPVTAALCPDQA